jgi:hypothetical protein
VVREIVDESFFDELPALIQQYHDGKATVPTVSAAVMKSATHVPKCTWPKALLQQFCVVAAKCTRHQSKGRATIAEVLPELEQLVVESSM